MGSPLHSRAETENYPKSRELITSGDYPDLLFLPLSNGGLKKLLYVMLRFTFSSKSFESFLAENGLCGEFFFFLDFIDIYDYY